MENSQYYNRLVELNLLAEQIFCQNKKLLLIDNNLNGIRSTKGGYRRNEITKNVSKMSIHNNLFLTLNKTQINDHLDNVEKLLTEQRDKSREKRKRLINELIKLNPSVTELPLDEAKFLLR
ncbi:conserved Plasmodium protein, unknown function [Plasmodium berghei]|uniref:Uncharacterized protein n=2 Tax=Plasmodium berghei TaxID=5821 RepID=A0A509AM64_PLABA|nr:conserved protein, unknown function [Plasmodium berghei ANKA]CXI19568.1 conserved Plasmodium protein, unknown function [Plasmodium berghei]SCM19862.1 conserved Plasmodium protein, unknown function [Plasmodium berghei]SCO59164.1 conserved Plasmodium protein, unknown function [Plasmodium berghei]SCO59949.1 conserved Plasmodium protein, unknown function [Plasmodium berghei]VUC54852.1 conserved protein, unknown function [Plasmodium berghei ANKA]|eukprot:XP_034420677.1 conserved protein, unknown function [Plasmodium berghei ANKA]